MERQRYAGAHHGSRPAHHVGSCGTEAKLGELVREADHVIRVDADDRTETRDALLKASHEGSGDDSPGWPLVRWEERSEDAALCETVHRAKGLERSLGLPPESPARAELVHWEGEYRRVQLEPNPELDLVLAWLKRTAPAAEAKPERKGKAVKTDKA